MSIDNIQTHFEENSNCDVEESCLAYNDNFIDSFETKILYEKFLLILDKDEQNFVKALEKYSSHVEISKKLKMPYNVSIKLKNRLRKKYENFIKSEGYKL